MGFVKKYLSELLMLAFPILSGNIAQMLINLGDVYVAGHYSTNTLAEVSIASAIFMTLVVAGFGLSSAISPVVSNYRGKRIPSKKFFNTTCVFSLVCAFVFFVIINLFLPFVYKLGLNPELTDGVYNYLKISSYSVFGMFLFGSLKEFLQAYEVVVVPNFLIMFSVVLNIVLNFIFVRGFLFIPEMGTSGLAYASLLVRTLLGVTVYFGYIRYFRGVNSRKTFSYVKDLIRTGAPISGAMFIEFLGFNIVAVLVGRFETIYAACHNIIISVVSLCYMVPFSISSALSVKIGFANGAKSLVDIKRFALSGFLFTFVFTLVVACFYVLFRYKVISLFTSDTTVINLGASIMLIVAAFTLFDGIQSVATGILKGLKETKAILIVMFLSYILFSIPIGLYLAHKRNMVLEGFWIGLAVGIFIAAIVSFLLFIRKYFKIKSTL